MSNSYYFSTTNFISSLQLERYEIFKAQNPETGHFDCALEIDGKKLYVHKYFLATASEYFRANLSDRWTISSDNKDGVFRISEYSYQNIYEFLCFLYSGSCNLTDENVFLFIDMAEIYGVQFFKRYCEEYLSRMKMDLDRIEDSIKFAEKYSLGLFKAAIDRFINCNFAQIIRSEHFLTYKKPFIEVLSKCKKFDEDFLDKVYEWAHHQVTLNQEKSQKEEDIKEGIKAELNGILCNMVFTENDFRFVKKLTNEKRFLFSAPELYKLFATSKRRCFEEQECFKILYELAKDEVEEKQRTFNDENFNQNDAIKKELTQVVRLFDFTKMDYDFLLNFVGKVLGWNFIAEPYRAGQSPAIIVARNFTQPNFRTIFFCFFGCVRLRAAMIAGDCPTLEPYMSVLVENGIFFSAHFYRVYAEKILVVNTWNINDTFKSMYQLAEKQVLMKQKFSSDANFNLNEAVKKELVEVLPLFDVTKMSSSALMEFVVAKNILSEEEKRRIFEVSIEIESNGKKISGIFSDVFGIRDSVPSYGYVEFPESNYKFWCNSFYGVPSFPSTVTKMEGADWYLCLDFNGALVVKHVSLLKSKDYLIAVVKTPDNDFSFDRNTKARLTVR